MKTALSLITLLFLVAIPASAGDSDEAIVQDTGTTESCEVREQSDEATGDTDLKPAKAFSVLDLLGMPSLVKTSLTPGYCYHDCSTCFTRDDCLEPGFPIGFPCTAIPLC